MSDHASVVVRYPPVDSQIILRTDADWNRDILPVEVTEDGRAHRFDLELSRSFCYFKPLLVTSAGERWAVGDNLLSYAGSEAPTIVYPFFFEDNVCSTCELHELIDTGTGRAHTWRVYYPPGYAENTEEHFPVLYMQDGQNLFFADEAFNGTHWQVNETLQTLTGMNAIRKVIVVGVYPNDRQWDYTAPGYYEYGRFMTETLKPAIDGYFRTLTDPANTAVIGSSLGGVVSFYLAWQFPDHFGNAACMSSTFGWRDDLAALVTREAKRPVRLYLDSGWPQDNYEATRAMRELMISRGYREGQDLHYFAFPGALHNEHAWATRIHIPIQLFFGGSTHPAPEALQ